MEPTVPPKTGSDTRFSTPYTFNKVAFQEGMHFFDGGWFTTLTVQVRQNGQWVNVSNLSITPAYAGNDGVSYETYTLTFTAIQGEGIRLYGTPGGSAAFISVGELGVFALSLPPPAYPKIDSGMNAETIQFGASTISLILRSAATLATT